MDNNETPQVVQDPTRPKVTYNPLKAWLPKILFAGLGIIIIVELVIGAKTLIAPLPAIGKTIPLSAGKVVLTANQSSYKVGDSVPVEVKVYTGGHNIDGADLSLKFDPNVLEASTSSFTKGNIYTEYPIINIDQTKGIIKVSGISAPDSNGFNGIGVFGNLEFKAKQPGSTVLSVQYSSNSTTETNLVETTTAKNILDNSYNLNLNISSTPVVSSNSAPNCSVRVHQICRDGSGRLGTYWCTSVTDSDSCNVGCFKEQDSNELGCKVSNLSTSGAK